MAAVSGLSSTDVAVIEGAYSDEFLTRLTLFSEIRRLGSLGNTVTGTTFHDRVAARLAINHGLVDIAFIRYNPIHTGANLDLFPYLRQPTPTLLYNFKSTIGSIGTERYAALGLNDDYWQPKVTDYYRFALTRPEIDGLLCSPSMPEEVEALAMALEEGPLDEEEENYLIDLGTLDQGRAELMPSLEGGS